MSHLMSTSRRALLFSLGAGLLFSSACSSVKNVPSLPEENVSWLDSGTIVIASPLPEVTSPSVRTMLGFLPADIDERGTWLSISLSEKTARLMKGAKEILSARINPMQKDGLAPGSYELLHKQRNALWYAPEDYFTNRRMSVPPSGGNERYLRGALGDFVLYIDRNLPLHCSPISAPEIGGIRVQEADLARLYYHLEVGALIEVE